MTFMQAIPVTKNVLKRFTTTIAIAATALGLLTAAAVPAHASKTSDEFAKALAGIAALAIIANSIDRNQRSHVTPKPQPYYQPHPYNPPVVRTPVLPAVCALRSDGRRRGEVLFSERCLKDQGFYYRLPQSCARNVHTRGRNDRVYPAWCLENAGFRIGRSHRPY